MSRSDPSHRHVEEARAQYPPRVLVPVSARSEVERLRRSKREVEDEMKVVLEEKRDLERILLDPKHWVWEQLKKSGKSE